NISPTPTSTTLPYTTLFRSNDLDPSTVDLDPSTPGQQTTRIVAGQGFWQVDSTGNVTFFPQAGFTHDPSPITYTVQDKTGLTSRSEEHTSELQLRSDLVCSL